MCNAFSLAARETTAPVNNQQLYTVTQVGVLRTGHVQCGGYLPLPEFVHQRGFFMNDAWLDFSALYFTPPQMTTGHQTFNVKQQLVSGTVQAWYPYAQVSNQSDSVSWTNVQVGVMADGLETNHPVWLSARGVASAATLKIYKDGSAPATPVEFDDPGTTEGEVYLFMRATMARTSVPLSLKLDESQGEWLIEPLRGLAASENTVTAWAVESQGADTLLSRRVKLAAADGMLLKTRTVAHLDAPQTSAPLDLKIQLNEALVGNGLHPDEAGVLSSLALRSLEGLRSPALLYIIPQQWTDSALPLTIEGPAAKPLRVFLGIAIPPPPPRL